MARYTHRANLGDSRLVFRLIQEGIASGGAALIYVEVKKILREKAGKAVGVDTIDTQTGETRQFNTPVVINATGTWTRQLHSPVNDRLQVRFLKGSHLVIDSRVLPLSTAVSFVHPEDSRFVFVIPWEGAVIFGTTDIEYSESLDKSPAISRNEFEYLLGGLQSLFPSLGIGEKDCISTYAGLRTILNKRGEKWPLSEAALRRLRGRYGNGAEKILKRCAETDFDFIPNTRTLWAELSYAAQYEQVRHLSDLILRRVRIGILTPDCAKAHLKNVREQCQKLLQWDDTQWENERQDYLRIIGKEYSIP